ncbi:tRNA-specific 2-thiouridylase MnmA [Candidatus Profftella armatura (Diaphorina cf. continua)]|uniref:tRNA-specific 2-thiouridylase MnmA n=1 Tax=Candidatus Profftella armatura (Diaphorina cf. continua) TaxID=2661583 RepID=A0A7R6VYQ2_9PROT|nr:tRNA 2-thiouridine(34) synthase MnmA [Candidatus Profftella armatura (Diaphorina cf. continua)]BCG49568.1 tRNA-specific 2-thiouridylase MnmA [Candidatus Profftella armatura (Diaphorina cf. continua)]
MFKKKVVVGMSGGVDSSVSSWLLKQQGYKVIGLFMKNWEDNDSINCTSRQDWIDAVSAADIIGIDIEIVNFSSEYKKRVFSNFLYEYKAGRTPNPDIFCNSEIKFKVFLDYAMRYLNADLIATGHYAQIKKNNNGKFQLLKAFDLSKDQSYFLYRLNQNQLAHTLFPLGKIKKSHVRKIAINLKLSNAMKKDSFGICFIGEKFFRNWLSKYINYKPGPIKTIDGKIIGKHIGLCFYTIGQRKGIGLGGIKSYQNNSGKSKPWYVVHKDIISNTLYVLQDRNHPYLFSSILLAEKITWIHKEPPNNFLLNAKIRYNHKDTDCFLYKNFKKNSFILKFNTPQWAITPGQSVVLYNNNICIGGGIIKKSY